jgi:hypothetical protein
MFKKGLDFVIHNFEIDRNGRYIIFDITIHSQRLTFVCLYGYNTDEPSLFNITCILQKVLTFSNTSILLCGDWNVVLDRYMDTYNIIHNRNHYSRKKITFTVMVTENTFISPFILPIFFYIFITVCFLKTHNGCVFTFGPIKYICPLFLSLKKVPSHSLTILLHYHPWS